MPKLYAFREDRLGCRFQIDKKAVLGRAPECDLILFDRSASRHHAEIFCLDDLYYIADTGSSNGTLLNGRPVTLQTKLAPFDSIGIGQEMFIFEPGIDVIIGPAPSAIIIEDAAEDARMGHSLPAQLAAAQAAADDMPALSDLAYKLCQATAAGDIEGLILDFLERRFGLTFMAVLWPSLPPATRLISFMSSCEGKRMLLSHTPFIRAVRERQVTLWPNTITELAFHEGQRLLGYSDFPALVGPLFGMNQSTGLLYLENKERAFTEGDLGLFAALIPIISPALTRLSDRRGREKAPRSPELQHPEAPLINSDDQVKIVFSTAAEAARGTASILISGEAGTGKSDLAEYIHNASSRRRARFVRAPLGGLQRGDIERAIFGQAPGPDEEPGQLGLMELADGGTLFLEQVELLPPPTQKTLLVAIEEGMFFPLQATRPRAIDVRIVSSTTVDLWSRVEGGFFREDLYLRLAGVSISMPPLRDIRGDLGHILVTHFYKAARSLGVPFVGLDPAARECLLAYPWPGNMAELTQEAKLMLLFSRNGRVTLEDLPAHLRLAAQSQGLDADDEQAPPLAREAERFQIIRAMARSGGDLAAVAAILGQKPEDIILRMRAYGLDPIDYQAEALDFRPREPAQTAPPTLY